MEWNQGRVETTEIPLWEQALLRLEIAVSDETPELWESLCGLTHAAAPEERHESRDSEPSAAA